jgi:hypothetical protein
VNSPLAPGSGETFDLESPISNEVTPPVAAQPMTDAPKVEKPRDIPTRRARDSSPARPEALVEEVWSRQAEWGTTLFILAIALLGLALVIHFLMSQELYGLGFLCLIVGVLGVVVLSYPILITLERPVRVTPEQAVRDFYGALSHHAPHFRRMWLLLSTAGRITSYYGSFEGFKAYWRDRLRTLKSTHTGLLTPLVFEVVDYSGDKSAGQARIEAQFTVKVSIRGQRQAGPIGTFPMRIGLVRGPDKMWYLENGTLPDPARARDRG